MAQLGRALPDVPSLESRLCRAIGHSSAVAQNTVVEEEYVMVIDADMLLRMPFDPIQLGTVPTFSGELLLVMLPSSRTCSTSADKGSQFYDVQCRSGSCLQIVIELHNFINAGCRICTQTVCRSTVIICVYCQLSSLPGLCTQV